MDPFVKEGCHLMCIILEPVHQEREEKPRQHVLCDSLFSSPLSEMVTILSPFLVAIIFFSSLPNISSAAGELTCRKLEVPSVLLLESFLPNVPPRHLF
jgi:hypothetical protein